jgi:endonuclease/exonuclease/phosphatase family metal-dependent hydrolase
MSDNGITVATVNIAGGMRAGEANPDKFKLLAASLAEYTPDIIGLQEVIRVPEAEHDDLKRIKNELGGDWYSFFSPHLDSYIDSHPRKWTSSIFEEYYLSGQRIYQGTGILIKNEKISENESPIAIVNLWDSKRSGEAENVGKIMPYPNTVYCGNRDTEPRSLMMVRVKIQGKYLLFCCTQLSTLTEEDNEIKKAEDTIKVRKPTFNSVRRREKQVRWIVEYLKSYQDELGVVEPIILVGDFNCEPSSRELKSFQEIDLVHAHQGLPDNWVNLKGWMKAPNPPFTHRVRVHFKEDRRILIDHIYVSSKDFSIKEANIIDLNNIENAGTHGKVSDHNPVIVKLSF